MFKATSEKEMEEGNFWERFMKIIEKQVEQIIDYAVELLENCTNDARDYLNNTPFKIKE